MDVLCKTFTRLSLASRINAVASRVPWGIQQRQQTNECYNGSTSANHSWMVPNIRHNKRDVFIPAMNYITLGTGPIAHPHIGVMPLTIADYQLPHQHRNKLPIYTFPTILGKNAQLKIQLPTITGHRDIRDPTSTEMVDVPSYPNVEKHAARLIVIRRRKMKKHKLRKLRKRMKFVWGRVKQRREARKEKKFQASLMAQIKNAESFNAELWVENLLKKVNTETLTTNK